MTAKHMEIQAEQGEDFFHHKVVFGRAGEGMSIFSQHLHDQSKSTGKARMGLVDRGRSSDLLSGLMRRL